MKKIESIRELKIICQKQKRNKSRSIGLVGYLIYRDISIYFTKLILVITNKKINPNLISLLNIILVIFGGFLLSNIDLFKNIIGFIFVYFSFIFDKVDGELARYLKRTSFKGIFLEQIYHFFLMPSIYIGVAIHLYLLENNSLFLFISLIGVVVLIFNTINSNFVYFILFFKRISFIKEIHNSHQISMTSKSKIILKLIKLLKFSTLAARTDFVIHIFLLSFLIDTYFKIEILALVFIVYSILISIRAFRMIVLRYFKIEDDIRDIVNNLYNNL